jgi:hypothetical protein
MTKLWQNEIITATTNKGQSYDKYKDYTASIATGD